METILIQGGLVYDGLGNPPIKADVLLRNGRVAKIGDCSDLSPDRIIDASGKTVCPGFVDIHRHHDAKILYDPRFGHTELRQGITTAVSGNCGISIAPRPAAPDRAREFYSFEEPVMGAIASLGPESFGEYLSALEAKPLPIHTAALIGTGSVKICVKGFDASPYTRQELERARQLIGDALDQGALGASMGIMYLPECYSSAREFATILEPLGQRGRPLTAHIRGEGDSMVASVAEAIEIARMAGCPLEISHFKSCGVHNWRTEIYRAIDLIESARAQDMDVTCDFYPYDGGSTALTTMLPPALVQGDMTRALERLGTPEGVEAFRKASRKTYSDWDNFSVTLGWERILISSVVRPENRPFLGMRVTEAAEKFGFPDPEALAAHLMHTDQGKTAIINMSMCQDDIDAVAKLPYSNVISDAIYADTDTPHPRMYGAFPKFLREYVRQRELMSFEEGIRKMTSQPADRMGLKDRGQLTVGAAADVLVFSQNCFQDHATYAAPAQCATGLDYAIVGGYVALEQDRPTGLCAGSLLRK